MKNSQAQLLASYAEAYSIKRPSHSVLLEAAADLRLTTEFLMKRATLDEIREREDTTEPSSTALLILQQRLTPSVLDIALDALQSQNPAKRQLGAKLLRERPCLNDAPYPHSPAAIEALSAAALIESDEEVLGWLLSAIGWQKHPDGAEILLSFRTDTRNNIRRTVANGLLLTVPALGQMPAQIAEAYLAFARDEDSDIRWSVYYDIRDCPSTFAPHLEKFIPALRHATENDCEENLELAGEAMIAIERHNAAS